MNQDEVKDILLQLEGDVPYFEVVFSGKASKKVDGLYSPEEQQIIIHNRNHKDDNGIVYTAVHEYAHHVHMARSPLPISNRSHTTEYWDIFHRLLGRAEEKGLYKNVFEDDERFQELTEKIRRDYMSRNGELMKDFGRLLIEALDLCQQTGASFEDYVERYIGLNRTTAKSAMKVYAMDVTPEIGYDNMKVVAGVSNSKERKQVEGDFIKGESPDMVKAKLQRAKKPDDERVRLEKEKTRIEKQIQRLNQKLADVDMKLETWDESEEGEA